MKFLKSTIKFTLAGFIVLLVTSTASFGQGTTGTTSSGYNIQSCYHVLNPSNSNPTLNVLNTGGFKFNYSNNAGARPDYVKIVTYDKSGVFMGFNYHSMGIADGTFHIAQHPVHGDLVAVMGYDVYEDLWVKNNNTFTFPEGAESVEITTYHWTGNVGQETLDESSYKLTFNLIDPSQAFSLDPTEQGCFTFDNFTIGYSHILDGFCGYLSNPKLSIAPPPPTGSGWNANFTQQLFFNTQTTINQPHWQGGTSWCDDACTGVTAPHYISDPVPCGCVDFDVTVELTPCPTADADCPIVEIKLPISICCDCDVREISPQN